MKEKKREMKIRDKIAGKKVESSSSSEAEEEEEESDDNDVIGEKEIPLEKKVIKKGDASDPVIKKVEGNSVLDDTKDGLLN